MSGPTRFCQRCGYDGHGDLPEHDLCAEAGNPTAQHDYATEGSS